MSCTKRKLFSSVPTEESVEGEQNGPAENVVYTVVSEGDSLPKESGSPCSLHNVDGTGFHASLNKDLAGKILIVGEGREAIQKQFADMKLPRGVELSCSSGADVALACSKARFLFIVLDMSCKPSNALKLCSTIRFGSNSQNRNVAIIGATTEGRPEDFSSHGINDIVHLPLKEATVLQLLLKWAGQTSCEGMPLTPESPDDDVVLARKAAEIIKETEEHSFLSYHHHAPPIPSVSCDYTHPIIPPETQAKISAGHDPLQFNPPLPGMKEEVPLEQTQRLTFSSHPYPVSSVSCSHIMQRPSLSHPNTLPVMYQSYRHLEHGTVHGPPSSEPSQYHQNVPRSVGPFHGSSQPYPSGTPHISATFGNFPTGTYPSFMPFKPLTSVRPVAHSTPSIFDDGPSPSSQMVKSMPSFGSPAYMVSGTPGSKDMKITMLHDDLSKHSSKERIRRERIKDSCDKLRYLLPNVAGKRSDMASILELTVKFVQAAREKMPRAVWEEISDKIAVYNATNSRKRSQKESNAKQGRPRVGPLRPAHQATMTKLPGILGEESCGSLKGRAPTMVTTTGPAYLPHFHMNLSSRPGMGPSALVPSHHAPVAGSASVMMPKEQLAVSNPYGQRRPVGVEVLPSVLPSGLHKPDKVDMPPASYRHHQQVYFNNPPFAMGMVHPDDIPMQLGVAKLPPISSISPCNSATDLSQCSLELESAASSKSSPDSATLPPPLWDMDSGRDDLLHGHAGLPTYK